IALGRSIVQRWFPGRKELAVLTLDSQLEHVLMQAMQSGSALEPGLADTLVQQTASTLEQQEARGEPPVLVVQHALRPLLANFLRRRSPQLTVLSFAEIPDDYHIRVTYRIGGH